MFKNILFLSAFLIPSISFANPKNVVMIDLKTEGLRVEENVDVKSANAEVIVEEKTSEYSNDNMVSKNYNYNIEVKISNNRTLENKFNLSVRSSLEHPISTFSGAKKSYPLEDTGNMKAIPFDYSYGSLITFEKVHKNNVGVVLLAKVETIESQEVDVKSQYGTINRQSSYSFFELKEGLNSFRVNDKKYEFNLVGSN